MLSQYNTCVFCNSKKLKLSSKIVKKSNFYSKALINDLKLKKSELNKIKIYKCLGCGLLQNNPWLTFDQISYLYSENQKVEILPFDLSKVNDATADVEQFAIKNDIPILKVGFESRVNQRTPFYKFFYTFYCI